MDVTNDTVGEGEKFVQVFGVKTTRNENSWKIRFRRRTLVSGEHTVMNRFCIFTLTLRLLISYIYGAPSKARNANVVYIWTYVWQR